MYAAQHGHRYREDSDEHQRFSLEWLAAKRIAVDPGVAWLKENGGHCGCEVLANVCEHFEENARPVYGD